VAYHDQEWGRPQTDDRLLFEKLCLEGFQCGLSWLTILRRRGGFREAFHGFDLERCARMNAEDIDRLLVDSRIIRHRGKIESVVNNARRALAIVEAHGSLATLLWSFAPTPRPAPPRPGQALPVQTDESERLSRRLKRDGFTFVGPTTVYAFMQAVGMVNDHLEGCVIRDQVESAQRRAQER
jgi:DNA-3-methyladenine glycosylase I